MLMADRARRRRAARQDFPFRRLLARLPGRRECDRHVHRPAVRAAMVKHAVRRHSSGNRGSGRLGVAGQDEVRRGEGKVQIDASVPAQARRQVLGEAHRQPSARHIERGHARGRKVEEPADLGKGGLVKTLLGGKCKRE
jgi:hypothetical protein